MKKISLLLVLLMALVFLTACDNEAENAFEDANQVVKKTVTNTIVQHDETTEVSQPAVDLDSTL